MIVQRRLAIVLTLLALVSTTAVAETSVLGSHGEVYRVLEGPFGDFFDSGDIASDNPVLVLEILYPDSKERHLVPGTQGGDREHSASLVYEAESNTVFVVWAADRELVSTRVVLAGFESLGESWSEIVDVSGDPFSFKGVPTLALSRDVIRSDDGSLAPRTILHAVWWEQNGVRAQVVYAPFVFHSGHFVARGEAAVLNDFFDAGSSDPSEGRSSLAVRPDVRSDGTGQSVSVTLFDAESDELVSGRIRIVAPALERIGARFRDYLASRAGSCSTPEELAAGAVEALADEEPLLDSALLDYLSTAAVSWIGERPELCSADEGELVGITEKARGHIILTGLRATDSRSIYEKARGHIILIGFRQSDRKLVTASVETLNRVALPGGSWDRLYVSSDAGKMIVAQEVEGAIEYRELGDDGWTDPLRLVLDADLSREEADRVLQQRVDSR